MFTKILIANRGEIACRVIRTARKMGIKTVAVYSDADAMAPHVRMADEAVRLGPPPASESYLLADAIVAACKATGAEAVHPGYGFLSERESFAKLLAENDIAFIGPPAKAIAAMGDKIESKKLAKAAGVNVVPGFLGEIDSTDHAVEIAGGIGYPVMMKASAGGGGKGMRLAWSEQDVRDGFEATKREGLASFGDDRVFIEKFIESPRHIEIQLLGDQHGNIVYLGERECSIQRRHQKVVEEAPSPFVTPDMRRAMGEQAVALAAAVGYYSAGTVELIVSGADKTGQGFYFLEMNTRLQVEHPVTEEITGLDLVEQMIRVAYGEKLAFGQDDVKLNGWAMESRVYAEDPYRNFLPSTGRLTRYAPPPESRTSDAVVRVDTGVFEGGEVSMFYDPMIAKLVTWAPTRAAAIDLQIAAIDRYEIAGVGTNLDFLSALSQHPRFRSGEITTGFIAEEYPEGFHGAPEQTGDACRRSRRRRRRSPRRMRCARCMSTDSSVRRSRRRTAGWCGSTARSMTSRSRPRPRRSTAPASACRWAIGRARRSSRPRSPARPISCGSRASAASMTVTTGGRARKVQVAPPRVAALRHHMIEKVAPDMSRFLVSPMPGLLTRLMVQLGDKVEAGQPLATVEAMKMENMLRAEKSATVSKVAAGVGESLAIDQVILEFE